MKSTAVDLLKAALLALVVGWGLVACRGEAEKATATATAVPAAATTSVPPSPTPQVGFANPELLVSTDWLAQHLNDPKLVVVDVRKADKYKEGHIPGAVNLVVSDPSGPFYDQNHPVKWMILPKEEFEGVIGSLGIDNDTTVVAYDETKGLWAARFFWALEYYGHDKARVLNGGITKWKAEGRQLTQEVPQVKTAVFTAQADESKYATKDQILGWLDDPNTVLVATVAEDEFTGKREMAKRGGGHIPGAIRIDWVENLTTGDTPVFKSAAELAQLYESAGVTKDKNVVVY